MATASQPQGEAVAAAPEKPPVVVLVPGLTDEIVLSVVLARFVDEDSLFTVLPFLNSRWRAALRSSALFYRELCISRAWVSLARAQLPIPSSAIDWPLRFYKRPRLRTGGPYCNTQLFLRFSGPRTMWTPKDTKPVEVVRHRRMFWFSDDDDTCVYAAVSTDHLDKLIEQVRNIRLALDRGQNTEGDGHRVFVGRYALERREEGLVVKVKAPMKIHMVQFEAFVLPGGSQCQIFKHQSMRYNDPIVSTHLFPWEGVRTMFYLPGYM